MGSQSNNVTIIADRVRSIFGQVIHPCFRAAGSIAVVSNGRAPYSLIPAYAAIATLDVDRNRVGLPPGGSFGP